jgi:predicted Fe-Mo cluster-binding NifX family protein
MMNENDFPDVSEMVDPIVNVHLTSGHVLKMAQVSIVEIAKRLQHHGFVYLSDGEGAYAVFFDHGVAALTVPPVADQRDT